MRLIWSDEFNGAAGHVPNSLLWGYNIGRWGSNDGELQYYTNLAANCQCDGASHLALAAIAQPAPDGGSPYTSARIYSKRRTGPGTRLEASICAPHTPGLTSGFWTLGIPDWPAGGEIDIVEFPAQLGTQQVSCHLHGPRLGAPTTDCGVGAAAPACPPYDWQFQTFGINWHAERIEWTLGQQIVGTIAAADFAAKGGDWTPFAQTGQCVLLNVAVGNNWTGPPTPDSVFPQTMLIDWVRAWSL